MKNVPSGYCCRSMRATPLWRTLDTARYMYWSSRSRSSAAFAQRSKKARASVPSLPPVSTAKGTSSALGYRARLATSVLRAAWPSRLAHALLKLELPAYADTITASMSSLEAPSWTITSRRACSTCPATGRASSGTICSNLGRGSKHLAAS